MLPWKNEKGANQNTDFSPHDHKSNMMLRLYRDVQVRGSIIDSRNSWYFDGEFSPEFHVDSAYADENEFGQF